MNGSLSDDEWQKNFRLTRDAFFKLEKDLRPFISPDPSSPNHRAMSAAKKLAITLYYLKDTGSLRMTANTFGIHVCTVSKTIHEVCRVLCYKLGPKLIKLPQSQSSCHKVKERWEKRLQNSRQSMVASRLLVA